jgi:thioredoxin 1
LTTENFEEEVLKATGTVLVDFYAVWCGPCSMIAPHVEALAEEYPALKVCRLDVDAATEVALQYGVRSIPTLLYFRDGKVIKTSVGYCSLEELRAMTEELL